MYVLLYFTDILSFKYSSQAWITSYQLLYFCLSGNLAKSKHVSMDILTHGNDIFPIWLVWSMLKLIPALANWSKNLITDWFMWVTRIPYYRINNLLVSLAEMFKWQLIDFYWLAKICVVTMVTKRLLSPGQPSPWQPDNGGSMRTANHYGKSIHIDRAEMTQKPAAYWWSIWPLWSAILDFGDGRRAHPSTCLVTVTPRHKIKYAACDQYMWWSSL